MLVALICLTAILIIREILSYKERARLTNAVIAKSPVEFRQLEQNTLHLKESKPKPEFQRPHGL